MLSSQPAYEFSGVISLDLGWSEAIESQAFDRVHRLGQTREVHVDRLVIADTVEDRVLALQERKKALADGSLGEGNGKKVGSKWKQSRAYHIRTDVVSFIRIECEGACKL